MWDSSAFLGALTPKFYVALTGTSSLISGLILIFEWWYFRKYGTSFIEQVSLTHLGPWLGGGNGDGEAPVGNGATGSVTSTNAGECKVWRNPMSLLRGAEYARLWASARRAPLTYYDMNLSAQEHQSWFGGGGTPADEALARAWREREPAARVAAARSALAVNPECPAALLLLAEEDSSTVLEAERLLKRALRSAEVAWRTSAAAAAAAGGGGCSAGGAAGAAAAEARRDAAVLAHVKRRTAMCARRLGRLRDAARMFRELARDAPPAFHAHENLIEVLLEQRAYADVQAVLAKYDDMNLPRSATICYTAALLRARAAAAAPARSAAESAALEAIYRAVEFNPHVPEYLLELRPLTLPPEHVLRRGDSEALAYAFWHLRHWRSAEGALRLLDAAWQAAERGVCGGALPGWPTASCAACADRELLPAHHRLSVFPRRRAPALLPLAAALCAATAALALLAHRWPDAAARALDPRSLLHLLSAV